MKKIALLISQASKQGGLQKYAKRTAAAFASKGHQVTLLTTGAVTANQPFESISLCSNYPLSLLNLWQYDLAARQWLREHPVDIVFGFDRTREQTHLRAGNGVHAAYLEQRALSESWLKNLSFSLNPLHRSILHIERTAFQSPRLQRLFTNSHMVKDEVLRFYGIDPSKIEVIHNGVEWTSLKPTFDGWPEARSAQLKAKNLPADAYYLLFVGHSYRRKGLQYLLEGLDRLRNSQVQLLVVGKDKEAEAFQALAAKLGLKDRVHFYGQQSDIFPFYQMADALVIPSLYDPFANVTVEALAMGLFVVSSRFNGGREVLNADNGAVIDDLTDPASVAAALGQAVAHPKSVVSAATIRHGIRHLDFSNQLDQLTERTLNSLA